jgi:diacylglycerol kinase (ATP)
MPGDLGALASTARRFRERDVDVVCVNGGDGSVHKVVTALAQAWGDAPLPRIAVLPGGTMNIVANSVGATGRPSDLLERLVAAYHTGEPLPTTRRWLMRFEGEGLDDGPRGFLFGNGIIARFLEVYYEGAEPTPAKAARLLAHGAMSALVNGRFVRRLTQPWQGTVTLDGAPWGGDIWTAVAIGTVEQIGLGFTPFHSLGENPGRMHVVGIGGTVVDLARDLPRIYRGRGPAQPGNLELPASEAVLRANEPIPFMIDGDFYRTGGELRISMERPVDFIVPGP